MITKQLHFKWTVSRGRDTYGNRICTLFVDGKKSGRCMGGGYDMKGTSLGEWLQKEYQTELCQLFSNEIKYLEVDNAARSYNTEEGAKIKYIKAEKFYGAIIYQNTKNLSVSVSLDGACGFESMQRIAEAIGIQIKWNPMSNEFKNHSFYTASINK